MRRAALPVSLALLLGIGCNPPENDEPLPCDGRITHVTERVGAHLSQGSPIAWESNPPATGQHYDSWAPWATAYDQPVPRGNYVHCLEHGGVALLYRGGIETVGASLAALGRALPQDPLCAPPLNARWIVTPDPLLPDGVAVAAAAWNHIYTASCFDGPSLDRFIRDHYGRGPEATCADGRVAW